MLDIPKFKKKISSLKSKEKKCVDSIEKINLEFDEKIKSFQESKSVKLKADKDKLKAIDTELKAIIGEITIAQIDNSISTEDYQELLLLVK